MTSFYIHRLIIEGLVDAEFTHGTHQGQHSIKIDISIASLDTESVQAVSALNGKNCLSLPSIIRLDLPGIPGQTVLTRPPSNSSIQERQATPGDTGSVVILIRNLKSRDTWWLKQGSTEQPRTYTSGEVLPLIAKLHRNRSTSSPVVST